MFVCYRANSPHCFLTSHGKYRYDFVRMMKRYFKTENALV